MQTTVLNTKADVVMVLSNTFEAVVDGRFLFAFTTHPARSPYNEQRETVDGFGRFYYIANRGLHAVAGRAARV